MPPAQPHHLCIDVLPLPPQHLSIAGAAGFNPPPLSPMKVEIHAEVKGSFSRSAVKVPAKSDRKNTRPGVIGRRASQLIQERLPPGKVIGKVQPRLNTPPESSVSARSAQAQRRRVHLSGCVFCSWCDLPPDGCCFSIMPQFPPSFRGTAGIFSESRPSRLKATPLFRKASRKSCRPRAAKNKIISLAICA